MEKRIVVEVELTSGERYPLTVKFNRVIKMEDNVKHLFNVNFKKEIIPLVLDQVKESLLETDIPIGNLKSIHFSISEDKEE